MIFLDCPAYLDSDGTVRCGLPAEVSCRFTMRSTDGPIEGVTIRCPVGHWFNGSIESLTWDSEDKHDQGNAAATGHRPREPLRPGPLRQFLTAAGRAGARSPMRTTIDRLAELDLPVDHAEAAAVRAYIHDWAVELDPTLTILWTPGLLQPEAPGQDPEHA